MQITTNATDRKAMVKKIAEFTGNQINYMGPPTFNYTVGQLIIDRDGVITSSGEEELEGLMSFLKEEGYLEEQVQELNITVPVGTDIPVRKHLLFMLHARSYLLNKVTRHETFAVSNQLVQTLEEAEPETLDDFTDQLAQEGNTVTGLTFDAENAIFTFPFSEKPEKNRAYTELAGLMVARAKDAKRVSADPVVAENEKYYLRIWLVQLGLGGSSGKETRKALLEGLAGHTAFRTKEDADRFAADQKAKREAAKAAKAAEAAPAPAEPEPEVATDAVSE